MKKVSTKGLTTSLIFITLIVIVFAIVTFFNFRNHVINKKMFENISSFEKLTYHSVKEAAEDTHLEPLKPADAFASVVSYKGNDYTVYAYVFQSEIEAFEYYKQSTGYSSAKQLICYYYQHTSFSGTEYIVYCGTNVLRVEGGKYSDFAEFVNWISTDFPIDYSEIYYNEYGTRLP